MPEKHLPVEPTRTPHVSSATKDPKISVISVSLTSMPATMMVTVLDLVPQEAVDKLLRYL